MEFKQLPSNPNPRPPQELPHLLSSMERNQATHISSSPFKNYASRPTPFKNHFKKHKNGYTNQSIPFYQSSKYQTSTPTNFTPRRPFFQNNPNKIPNLSHLKRVPKLTPPPPQLINISDSKKFVELSKNVQPGVTVDILGAVEKTVKEAKLENLVYNLGKLYYPHLMGEFYCNMRVQKGLDGVLHFTTVVGGKLMLVDHKSINRGLLLPNKHSSQPCIDIYSHFVFNKQEFQLLVSNFCDSDVPPGLCNVNCGIHFKHFNPIFQQLALIVRANILSKPNQSKYFDFFDLKLMFHIVTNRINFSIGYVILLNMINANLVDYMPYGTLLTPVFNVYHVFMHLPFASEADSHLTLSHVRAQVPLSSCEPQKFKPTLIPSIQCEENITLANNESVKVMFEELKTEIRMLKAENVNILGRLSYLEGLAAGTLSNNGHLDMEGMNIYQVQMVNEGQMINNIDMFHEIEAVGAGISGNEAGNQGGENGDDLGYIVDMEQTLG